MALDIRLRDFHDRPLWYRLMAEEVEFFVEDERVKFLSEKGASQRFFYL